MQSKTSFKRCVVNSLEKRPTLSYVGIKNRRRDLGHRCPALGDPQTSLSHQRNFVVVIVEAFEEQFVVCLRDTVRFAKLGCGQALIIATQQIATRLSGKVNGLTGDAIRQSDRQTSDPVAEVQRRLQYFGDPRRDRNNIARSAGDRANRPRRTTKRATELSERSLDLIHGLARDIQ